MGGVDTTEVTDQTPAASLVGRAIWIYPALVLPSLFIVQKLLGSAGAATYAAVAALVVVASARIPAPRNRREELLVGLALLALLIVTLALIYPRANVQREKTVVSRRGSAARSCR